MYTTTEIHMDNSPKVKTFPRQTTYGMIERRRQWLNLARCPAANLRTMVTTLIQQCSLTFDE